MPQPPDWRGIAWNRGLIGVLLLSAIIGLVGGLLIRWPLTFALFGATPIFPLLLAVVVNYGEYLRGASIPYAQLSWFGSKGVPISSFVQVPAAVVVGFVLGLLGLSVGIAIGGGGRLVVHGLRAQRR